MLNPEKYDMNILKAVNFFTELFKNKKVSTSPVRCSHITLGNLKVIKIVEIGYFFDRIVFLNTR